MNAFQLTIAGMMLVLAFSAAADSLRVGPGDVLHGRLEELSDGAVVFNSTIAGTVIVPTDQVRGLATDGSQRVVLTDGRVYFGRLVDSKDGLQIFPDDGTSPISTQVADLKSVTSDPSAQTARAAGARSLLDVAVEAGILARSGTRDFTEPYAGLRLRHETPSSEVDGRLMLTLDTPESFPRYLRGQLAWEDAGDRQWRPRVALDIDRDWNEGLDARVGLGAGVTSRLVDSPSATLSADLGIGVSASWYDRRGLGGEKWDFYYFSESSDQRESQIEARMGMRLDQDLLTRLALSSELLLVPSLTNLGDLRARTESALEWSLTKQFRLKLNMQLDYESDPYWRGQDRWRSSIGAGVMWNF